MKKRPPELLAAYIKRLNVESSFLLYTARIMSSNALSAAVLLLIAGLAQSQQFYPHSLPNYYALPPHAYPSQRYFFSSNRDKFADYTHINPSTNPYNNFEARKIIPLRSANLFRSADTDQARYIDLFGDWTVTWSTYTSTISTTISTTCTTSTAALIGN